MPRTLRLISSGNKTLSKFSSTKESEQIKRFSIFRKSDMIAVFKKKLNLNF